MGKNLLPIRKPSGKPYSVTSITTLRRDSPKKYFLQPITTTEQISIKVTKWLSIRLKVFTRNRLSINLVLMGVTKKKLVIGSGTLATTIHQRRCSVLVINQFSFKCLFNVLLIIKTVYCCGFCVRLYYRTIIFQAVYKS